MAYIVLAIIVLAILVFIIKSKNTSPSNPKGFAQSIAKAQIVSLRAFKEKYPNLSKEELYFQALSTRPGYTEDTIRGIIESAKKSAEKRGGVLKFSEVVSQLVIIEYLRRTGEATRDFSQTPELIEGVHSVIPKNLENGEYSQIDETVSSSVNSKKIEEASKNELLKKAAGRAQKPETALDELCSIIIKFYRAIGAQNNCAPSAKTSDEEIVEIYSRVATAFKDAAKERGEKIPAVFINRIALYFFQIKEEWDNEMIDSHLDYEIKRYIESGLRSEYREGLSFT